MTRSWSNSAGVTSADGNPLRFFALRRFSWLVRRFAELLRHGHIFQEERYQYGCGAEQEDCHEPMPSFVTISNLIYVLSLRLS